MPALEADLRKYSPPPEAVAKQARAVADALHARPGKVGQAQLADYRKALLARGQKLDSLTWDEAEQVALGLLALDRAEGGKKAPEIKAVLKLLAFPPKYDSRPDFREIKRDDKGDKTKPFDKQWDELFGKLK